MSLEDAKAEPAPVNKLDLPTLGRGLFWFTGLLTFVVGCVFVGDKVAATPTCTGVSCIGPALTWGGWTARDANAGWRSVFTLAPNNFVRNFTPAITGWVLMMVHLQGFNIRPLTRSWLHVAATLLFVVLFALIPYAGDLGIIFAGVALITLVLSLVLFVLRNGDPTTLHLGMVHSRFFDCIADNALSITIARVLGFGLGLFTFVIGLMHVFLSNFNWCPGAGTNQCVGPSIRWSPATSGPSFVADLNNESGWRGIFTLQPEIVGPLWGPTVLGFLTTVQHLDGWLWPSIYGSFPRVSMWFLFLGLFCGFGYVGNLGILLGFACVFQSLLCILITLGGGGNSTTHFSFRLHR